jgi:2-hydroxychromene-2-carboxylate isomerase
MIPGRPSSVEFFFSFRSPYSYLAAPRAFRLPSRFNVEIDFRPVPPMVERGVPLPLSKKLYIVCDAAREARRLGMRFGHLFDPIGRGVHNCLAIAEYAKISGRHVDFVLAVSKAIWADGIDVSNEAKLSSLCRGVGLPWSECVQAIEDSAIAERLEDNRQRLSDHDHWGVPTMVFEGEVFWGQDRIVDLELRLAEAGLSTAPRLAHSSGPSARAR